MSAKLLYLRRTSYQLVTKSRLGIQSKMLIFRLKARILEYGNERGDCDCGS